jgi:hypothetical protein
MPTATITIDSLIAQHAADLAYVAENPTPATTLDELVHHLTYAAENFDLARINGHEDLETAATLLAEAGQAEGADRDTFILRAAALLKEVRDMTDEYRTMVGE